MPTKTGAGQYSASQSTDAVKRAVDGLQEPINTSPKDTGLLHLLQVLCHTGSAKIF